MDEVFADPQVRHLGMAQTISDDERGDITLVAQGFNLDGSAGTYATRALGATVASFVGLSEVLFAIVFAWLVLGELPTPVQLAGGTLVVSGVVAVRLGERSSSAT